MDKTTETQVVNMTLLCHILSAKINIIKHTNYEYILKGVTMQISRLFEIVYILMNKKNTTAKELGEHFEVSQRTIYRDIETLCQAGIPIYTTKGKGGGIALMENFVLNKSVLSEREQNDILSALSGFKAITKEDTGQALSKLGAMFGNKRSDWIEVDFSNWNRTEEDKDKFNLLKDSIMSCNVIAFYYYNSNGEKSFRSIEPYKLVFRSQAWYLFGYCRDRQDVRYFKVSRMRDLKVENENFQINQKAFLTSAEPPVTITYPKLSVHLRVSSEMGYRVYDEFPQESISINEDGSFDIRSVLEYGNWIPGYLMSYEEHLEVLEPAELREQVIQKYQRALERYLT